MEFDFVVEAVLAFRHQPGVHSEYCMQMHGRFFFYMTCRVAVSKVR